MSESDLHRYDLALCNYVLGNIRQHLHDPTFRKWLSEQIEPPELARFVVEEDGDQSNEALLLNRTELYELADCISDMPLGCYLPWLPYEALHRRHIDCVHEVQRKLMHTTAEEWTKVSTAFAGQLELPDLKLDHGIAIATEWICELRRYKMAMKRFDLMPRPDGEFPTPSANDSSGRSDAKQPTQADFDEAEIQHVLSAVNRFGKMYDGRHKQPKYIIKEAKMNPSKCRKILRELENRGLYDGFGRGRSHRYEKS